MGSPVQFRRGDGVDVQAMLWMGKHAEDVGAADVKDFRAFGIDCHSQSTTTLVTASYGNLMPGDYIVKAFGSGLDSPPTAITVEDAATIATWRRTVTSPDGWEDWAAYETLGGDEV